MFEGVRDLFRSSPNHSNCAGPRHVVRPAGERRGESDRVVDRSGSQRPAMTLCSSVRAFHSKSDFTAFGIGPSIGSGSAMGGRSERCRVQSASQVATLSSATLRIEAVFLRQLSRVLPPYGSNLR